METTPLLTTAQRRQVVEHFATKCVEEWPSDEMPKAEFYQDLHKEDYRLQAMKGIEKVILESDWDDLIYWLLRDQAYDRDPEGTLHQLGYIEEQKDYYKWELSDNISAAINVAARF